MAFQAPREASSVPAGYAPPNDAYESTEHALVVVVVATAAGDTTDDQDEFPEHALVVAVVAAVDTTHDQDGFPEHDAVVPQQQFLDDGQFLDGEDSQRQFLEDGHEDEDMVYLDLEQVESACRVIVTVLDPRDLEGYSDLDIYRFAAALTLFFRFPPLDESPSYANGGFGAVPASAAAVDGLEKRVFHACSDDDHGGGCAICLEEEFEEGQQLSVMPCANGHAFHTACITAWLEQSNMCPLCRHPLPASED